MIIKQVRRLIRSNAFKVTHRHHETDFIRNRILTFPVVIILITQKSLKSLQLVLNEFMFKLGKELQLVSASAFTQARAKLSHKAFIELNQKAVIATYYQDDDYQTFRGFRLLAVDGSKMPLPNTPSMCDEFGTIRIGSNYKGVGPDRYPVAMVSVMYDLLNRIVLDATLSHARASEEDMAIAHLEHAQPGDLVIGDRNYPSYRVIATHVQKNIGFVFRCSRVSFKTARLMFDPYTTSADQTVTLQPHHAKKKQIKALGLPMQITVRFVRVILKTGEVEVLVTSLIDPKTYPRQMFKALYNRRWGIETYYGTIYGRLNLENFSGLTPEAVYQDFHSTIFISNIESVIIEDAQEQLDQKQETNENTYPQQVNKAVSFNAIKNHIIQLFYQHKHPDQILEQMTQMFIQKPVSVRKDRDVPRTPKSSNVNWRRLYNYHKKKKKVCF